MKRLVKSFVLFVAVICLLTTIHSGGLSVNTYGLDLGGLIEEYGLTQSYVGIEVKSLKSGGLLLSRNRNKYFVPGSNQKLITTWLALTELGADFRFNTGIYVPKSTQLRTDRVNAGLLIKGGGDPTLTAKELGRKISQFFGGREKKFSGGLKLDLSFFDDQYFGSGWMWDDNNNFIAPLSFKSVKESINSPYDSGEVTEEIGYQVSSWLSNNGIEMNGHISGGKLDSTWKKIFSITSEPLTEILTEMNLRSNNFYADMIWKTISGENGNGTFENSAQLARVALADAGVDTDVTFVDGSGLSRYNIISPHRIVGLLSYAFSHPRLSPESTFGYSYFNWAYENGRNYFISTLPKWGTGTLSYRKYDLSVRAKTGTLEDSSTISGYLKKGDEILAFSIMVNRVKNIDQARRFQDELLRELYELM